MTDERTPEETKKDTTTIDWLFANPGLHMVKIPQPIRMQFQYLNKMGIISWTESKGWLVNKEAWECYLDLTKPKA